MNGLRFEKLIYEYVREGRIGTFYFVFFSLFFVICISVSILRDRTCIYSTHRKKKERNLFMGYWYWLANEVNQIYSDAYYQSESVHTNNSSASIIIVIFLLLSLFIPTLWNVCAVITLKITVKCKLFIQRFLRNVTSNDNMGFPERSK